MTDRIEALERLQRLRESGALSEEELAAEKAALLGRADAVAQDREPAGRHEETVVVSRAGRRPEWLVPAALLAVLTVLAIAAVLILRGGPGEGADTAAVNVAAPAAEAPAGNVAEPQPPPGIRTRPEAEQLAAAFHAAFGRSGSAERRIEDGIATFTPGRLVWIGDRAALVSPGQIDEGCHGCYGTLAIHYLRPTQTGFEVERAWFDRAGGSSWGSPGVEWTISDRFAANPVIYSEGGFTGQGYTCSVALLTELRPDGPVQSDPVPLSMSNAGAVLEETGATAGGEPLREVEGQIVSVRKGRGFTVRFSGTERFDESYAYRNGQFVRTSGESRATC